ncbi:MAG: hypothetical protein WC880_00195 [Candidatus Paceibacterota bacterium]
MGEAISSPDNGRKILEAPVLRGALDTIDRSLKLMASRLGTQVEKALAATGEKSGVVLARRELAFLGLSPSQIRETAGYKALEAVLSQLKGVSYGILIETDREVPMGGELFVTVRSGDLKDFTGGPDAGKPIVGGGA